MMHQSQMPPPSPVLGGSTIPADESDELEGGVGVEPAELPLLEGWLEGVDELPSSLTYHIKSAFSMEAWYSLPTEVSRYTSI